MCTQAGNDSLSASRAISLYLSLSHALFVSLSLSLSHTRTHAHLKDMNSRGTFWFHELFFHCLHQPLPVGSRHISATKHGNMCERRSRQNESSKKIERMRKNWSGCGQICAESCSHLTQLAWKGRQQQWCCVCFDDKGRGRNTRERTTEEGHVCRVCTCVCLGDEALTFCRGQVEWLGANKRAGHPALQAHIVIGGEASDEKKNTFIKCLNCH